MNRDTTSMRIAIMGFRGVPSGYSGIETICENLFADFASRGHKPTIYCRPGVLDTPTGEHRGIKLVRTPAPGGKNGETLSHTLFSLMHGIRKGDVHDGGKKFDLISFHSIAPNFFIRLAKMAGIPVISHVHGLDHLRSKWAGLGSKVIFKAERSMVKHATRIVTVNQEIVDYYRKTYNVEAALLPNGIHKITDDFSPDATTLEKFGIAPGKFVVSIGRLVPEKCCHDTIAAFKNVKTDYKLLFVGEGKHTPEYVQQIKEQAANDNRIIFTGHQGGAALQTLFRCARLYVTASELEGMPSSLLECLERKVCPVVSDIAPHMELVNRVAGYDLSFKTGDVAQLTEKIQHALSDEPKLDRLAAGAREMVREHYQWPDLAAKTEAFYKQVLTENA
jgi:glycosyltransferase involved in cell wall biosynthesis